MKKTFIIAGILVSMTTTSFAADVGFDLNINIGNRPRVIAAPPPSPVMIAEPPHFICPQPLGMFVAVGIPYDLFYIGASYYLFSDGVWYHGSHYNGPWRVAHYKSLPPGLRKHEIHRIREIRDHEYHTYATDRDHYRGRQFFPSRAGKKHATKKGSSWKEAHREESGARGGHGGRGRHHRGED